MGEVNVVQIQYIVIKQTENFGISSSCNFELHQLKLCPHQTFTNGASPPSSSRKIETILPSIFNK